MFKKIVGIMMIVLLGSFNVLAQESKGNLEIVTTLFPTYDFAKQIGQDKVNVSLLLPPGVETHSFEPKPQDVVKINKADVFIYTGKYMEPWAGDILKGVSNKNLSVVDSSSGIELMSETEHDHGDHAFEWAGSFDLEPGEYVWSFAKVGGEYADPAMKMVILPASKTGAEGIEEVEKTAEGLLKSEETDVRKAGEILAPSAASAFRLNFDPGEEMTVFRVKIENRGTYVFFTEHMPTEFEDNEHFFKDVTGQDIEPVAQEPEHEHSHGEAHEHGHGHHHHGGKDPHIWVDLGHAQTMVDTIAKAFAEKDSANREFYFNNAKEYKTKLADLDRRFQKILSTAKHKTIIYGGHFAFGYFAKRYGLDHESPYEGFSPNAEPSPKAIAELINKLKASGIKVIYYEELLDPKVARTIAQETGAKLELLHGAHNVSKDELSEGVTFLKIMEDNLKKLKVGLECQ